MRKVSTNIHQLTTIVGHVLNFEGLSRELATNLPLKKVEAIYIQIGLIAGMICFLLLWFILNHIFTSYNKSSEEVTLP